MCLVIVFQPVCGVINFERNFIFLMKPFSKHDTNSTQNLKYCQNKKSLEDEIKSMFRNF